MVKTTSVEIASEAEVNLIRECIRLRDEADRNFQAFIKATVIAGLMAFLAVAALLWGSFAR